MKNSLIEIDREMFHLMMRRLSPHHAKHHMPEAQFQDMRRIAARLADATAAQTDLPVRIDVGGAQ